MNWPGLRIGLVGPLPPPSGGMANQTQQLATLLQREGAQVQLVQVNPPYRPAWVGGIRVLRAAFRLPPYIARLWRVAGSVQLLHVMANSYGAWYLFAAPAIVVGRLRRVPVIVNYRGGGAERFLQRSSRSVRALVKRSAGLVVPSGFLQGVFASFGMRSTIVPNVVDLSRFRFEPRSTQTAPHFVVTRNLEAIYDVPTALRAFARVVDRYPDSHLTIAGSGPEQAALQELAGRLGMTRHVTFTGRIDNERMGELYRSATTMINPSRVDNMPISILESLASGVPVVTTNVGGISFMVEHEKSALLVPPADPGAMADALLRVLDSPELAKRLAEEGVREVQKYSWKSVREALLAVYECALTTGDVADVADAR